MTGQESLLKQTDHRSSVTAGRSPYSPRVMVGQIGTADIEALVHNLPPDTSVSTMLQGTDGAFLFTLGFDDFGGGAVLG